MIPTKLGYGINTASQDLISAYTQGIMAVSVISNYKYLFHCVNSFIDRFYSYAKGVVAKFAVSKENQAFDGLKTLTLMIYMCASLMFSLYVTLCSDFINLFFGEKFVLNFTTVILLSLEQFIE